MPTEPFLMDPNSLPDTWLLWIGSNQYGSLCMDSSTGTIKQLEYRDHDLFCADVFVRHAAELFTDRAAIKTIRVAFRLSDWCWTPTAFTSEKEAVKKWISPCWPDRIGHRWVADGSGPREATAWVLTPDHIRDQLHYLCPTVEYKHATGFIQPTEKTDATLLKIVRVKNECWVSLQKSDRFLYGQPHRIETVGDLLFVLSELTHRFELNWADLSINLSGQWESDSDLLSSLRSRSVQISFGETPWSFAGPAHWFAPLYELLTCA